MAYTLEPAPLPISINTTTEVYVQLTVWEEIKLFFSDTKQVALYIIIPFFGTVYFSFILLYCVHKLRRYTRSNRKQRREARKAEADNDKAAIIDNEGTDSNPSSPYVKRMHGPVFLTYHDKASVPDESNLYPATNRSTLHPPRPQVSRSAPKMTRITTKPKTQIIIRCRCTGSIHEPGCHKFTAPPALKPSTNPLSASASDISVGMREALDKVSSWEHQLKTNPKTQALLNKYREIRKNKARRQWDENEVKGNWQQVPIANILERKRRMREGNSTSLSSNTNMDT